MGFRWAATMQLLHLTCGLESDGVQTPSSMLFFHSQQRSTHSGADPWRPEAMTGTAGGDRFESMNGGAADG